MLSKKCINLGVLSTVWRQSVLAASVTTQNRCLTVLTDRKDAKLVGVDVINFQQQRNLRRWKERTLRVMHQRGKSFDKVQEKLRARSEWQDWNYSAEVYAFAQRLCEPKLTEESLTRAFMHRSYVSAQEAKQHELGISDINLNLLDNSGLIEQGHKLVESYSKRYLRYFLRDAPEECIESLSQYLLSKTVMSDIAKWIGCIDLVFCAELPPDEETLANTVLSIVATIEEQSGISQAESFIVDFIMTYLNGVDLLEVWPLHELGLDLNQYLKSKGEKEIEPRIMYKSATGTLESCYIVGIYQDGELLGQSPGESPEIAKRMAELDAFRNLFSLTVDRVAFQYGPNARNLKLDAFEKPNSYILS